MGANCLIIGRRKQGKTTLAYHLAREAQQGSNAPIIVFDPNGQFKGVSVWTDNIDTFGYYLSSGESPVAFVPG